MPKKAGLSPKIKRFCEEYTTDLNGKQAAIRAGYSEKTAENQASRLLRNVKVKNYIKKLQAELEEKTKVTAEKVIKEFAKIAFHNPKSLFDEDGNIIPVNQLPDDVAAAITEIKTKHFKPNKDEDGILVETTYKTSNKASALENLGKHLGIFERDNKQKGESSAALFLELMKQSSAS